MDDHSPVELKEQSKKKEQSGEDCRCKEVSKKTAPELLKIMFQDLAFWKKSLRKK